MYAYQVWLDKLTLVILLTINSLPFKHDVNPFSMLVRDNIYVYKLIRLTKSAGLGCIFIPDGNS